MPNKVFTSRLADLEFIKQKRCYTNISEVLYCKINEGIPNILSLPNEESSLFSNDVKSRLISFF
jgi:hypothetical protein